MPVMLKVALGSVGVLFVAALVLMYSDKRYVEGWTHSESMGFMLIKPSDVSAISHTDRPWMCDSLVVAYSRY